MNEIDIGTIFAMIAVIIGTGMALGGWKIMPTQVRLTALALILMFVGYQLIEFIGINFVVVAK